MDTLSYDIVIEIIQHINMLNAVSLCRLEQVSKSFQYCAKKVGITCTLLVRKMFIIG